MIRLSRESMEAASDPGAWQAVPEGLPDQLPPGEYELQ